MRYSRISIDSGTMSKAVSDRFVKSFLDLFVLELLDDGPKHGYEIMRELKIRTGARIGVGGPETSCRGMEFSKPAKQKDLQDYRAGHEAQEARLQEHRTSSPALNYRLPAVTQSRKLPETLRPTGGLLVRAIASGYAPRL